MPVVSKSSQKQTGDVSKSYPLIVSYYMGAQYYYDAGEQLKKDCDNLGLDHYVIEADLKQPATWIDMCRFKIKFINEAMQKHKRPILWVDVDCRLLARPEILKNSHADIAFFLRAFRYFKDYDPLIISRTIDPSLVYYGYTELGRGFVKLMKDLEAKHHGSATDDYFLQEAWLKFDRPMSVLLLPPDMRSLELTHKNREFFYFGRSGNVAEHKDKAEQHPVALHTAQGRKKFFVREALNLIADGHDRLALPLLKRASELDKSDAVLAAKVGRLQKRLRLSTRVKNSIKSRLGDIRYKLSIKQLDPKNLYFGQQKVSTQDLLGENYHTVLVTDTPHYKFTQGNKKAYLDYLEASWRYDRPNTNLPEVREERAAKFQKLVGDIKENGIFPPVEVTTRFDGKQVIIHGNHRAAVAAHWGMKVPAIEVPIETHLQSTTHNPGERYGTKLKDIPYQSVFYNGEIILKGRRADIIERAKLLDPKDIKGKTVLDMGCNIGSASFRAAELGAKKVYGYDVSPKLTTAATRINSMLALPCYFAVGDFSQKVDLPRCDTGFVFSIDQHVGNDKMLADNIKRGVKSVVYFECHERADMPEEIKKIFSKITQVGSTSRGTRKFYRCELKDGK